jgi:hypothetical protein
VLDEDAMKNAEGKEKWRPLLMKYEKKVKGVAAVQ